MEDKLITVPEFAKMIGSNPNKAYEIVKADLIPVLILGKVKIRQKAAEEFLIRYEGYDLTNLNDIKPINLTKLRRE